VPTSSVITQARKRRGRNVLPEVFERTCGPVAGEPGPAAEMAALGTARGSFLRWWRLLAIDGFEVDLPGSDESALTVKASAAAGLDPGRISFARTLRLIRRTATGTADIPPSRLG
jgi:hypothetical protein